MSNMDLHRQQPELGGNGPSLGISSADTGVFKAWHSSIPELGQPVPCRAARPRCLCCAAAGLQGVNRPARMGAGGEEGSVL